MYNVSGNFFYRVRLKTQNCVTDLESHGQLSSFATVPKALWNISVTGNCIGCGHEFQTGMYVSFYEPLSVGPAEDLRYHLPLVSEVRGLSNSFAASTGHE